MDSIYSVEEEDPPIHQKARVNPLILNPTPSTLNLSLIPKLQDFGLRVLGFNKMTPIHVTFAGIARP